MHFTLFLTENWKIKLGIKSLWSKEISKIKDGALFEILSKLVQSCLCVQKSRQLNKRVTLNVGGERHEVNTFTVSPNNHENHKKEKFELFQTYYTALFRVCNTMTKYITACNPLTLSLLGYFYLIWFCP